ncbi:GFA family protein [Martelella endophytica]|uniref:Aldehyde-activating protein n=1 Tax=Martelella endophytica TaxID=1486262 RepID=A0A0D5LS62_MAREN|nr:GFA family protein [Martelella endophytica]AJY46617.1 aldehyde-activating protein [Martelella endophytica]
MNEAQSYSGGCQCGAVRFRASHLGRPSICHCRMCQKAFGGFFAAFVTADIAHLQWTRGKPKLYRSSANFLRGFCEHCGTPLTYQHKGGIELAIGAFDEPALFEPQVQVNHECRLPWIETLFEKPVIPHGPDEEPVVSWQHPDHDTEQWPPEDEPGA